MEIYSSKKREQNGSLTPQDSRNDCKTEED